MNESRNDRNRVNSNIFLLYLQRLYLKSTQKEKIEDKRRRKKNRGEGKGRMGEEEKEKWGGGKGRKKTREGGTKKEMKDKEILTSTAILNPNLPSAKRGTSIWYGSDHIPLDSSFPSKPSVSPIPITSRSSHTHGARKGKENI